MAKPHRRDPPIWSLATVCILYEWIVKRFGPLDTWEKKDLPLPGRGLDDEFQAFCESFARLIGAKSSKAVLLQIRLSLPDAPMTDSAGTIQMTALRNKVATYEAGFIRSTHVPTRIKVGPSKS